MDENVILLFGLVIVGMVVQFVKKMADLEAAGTLMTPLGYVRTRVWGTMLAVISTLLLAYIFHLMGELNRLAALTVGLYCTEAFDSLRARAVGRMRDLNGMGDEEKKQNQLGTGQGQHGAPSER